MNESDANEGRGPRCLCGHYRTEHDGHHARCRGAYATLMADGDDFESVEVHCPCDNFYAVEANYHERRAS